MQKSWIIVQVNNSNKKYINAQELKKHTRTDKKRNKLNKFQYLKYTYIVLEIMQAIPEMTHVLLMTQQVNTCQ